MVFLGAVLVTAQFMTALEQRTVRAFDAYVAGVDAEIRAQANRPPGRIAWTTGVRHRAAGKGVDGGLIHDWSAVTFVKGGRLAAARAVLEDFGRHSAIYPEVVAGRVERRGPGQVEGFHRLRKKKIIEVVLEAKYRLDVLASPENRYVSRTVATEIAEIDGDKRLPPGHDHGFLWRLQTYWVLEETPEGLWMEVRSVTLTRDVPFAIGWAVKPMVRELPKESLEALLAATSRAIASR